MVKIRLNRLSFYAYHGVLPEEKERGQEFLVSVELDADLEGISRTDDLKETIDYVDVSLLIEKIMLKERYDLIESVADRLAGELVKINKVNHVTVTVEKPRPPLPVLNDGVSATISRSR
ncbi:MAG: dihydroneopterin aldolase [Firmicutes bacterium]|nr:dihydroneopterin aldolase [Bacillota bacterium]